MEGGERFVTSVLEVCSVGQSDAGEYSCVATNGRGNSSAKMELTVSSPSKLAFNFLLRKHTTCRKFTNNKYYLQKIVSWVFTPQKLPYSFDPEPLATALKEQ